MESILIWQLNGFLLAFLALVAVSSLGFYSPISRIWVIRTFFVSVSLMTLLYLLPIENAVVVSLKSDSGASIALGAVQGLIEPILWIICVVAVVRLAQLIRQHLNLLGQIRNGQPLLEGIAIEQLAVLCNELKTTSTPKLYLSDSVESACTYGIREPAILLSNKIASDPQKLRMALTHELHHINRRDWLWDQIGQVVNILFPIDALIRSLRIKHRRYLEHLCDSQCLESGIDGLIYAEFLHGLRKQSLLANQAALHAAELSSIGERVELLLNNQRPTQLLPNGLATSLAVLMLSLSGFLGITNWNISLVEPETTTSGTLVIYEGREVIEGLPQLVNDPMESPGLSQVDLSIPNSDISDAIQVEITEPEYAPAQIEPP